MTDIRVQDTFTIPVTQDLSSESGPDCKFLDALDKNIM